MEFQYSSLQPEVSDEECVSAQKILISNKMLQMALGNVFLVSSVFVFHLFRVFLKKKKIFGICTEKSSIISSKAALKLPKAIYSP